MEDFISSVINSFRLFIEKNLKADKLSGDYLISFAIPNSNADLRIDHCLRTFNPSIFFEKPAQNYSIMALDSVYEAVSEDVNVFETLENSFAKFKNHVLNNWLDHGLISVPLIFCAHKFNSAKNDIWTDYPNSLWFIPRICLISDNKKNFIILNYVPNSDLEVNDSLTRCRQQLELLLDDNNEFTTGEKISITGLNRSSLQEERWNVQVNKSLQSILKKEISKAVIAKSLELTLSGYPNFDLIISRLAISYPDCFVFAYHNFESVFFGASPEKLISFSNGHVEIDILAGSAPRGKSNFEDVKLEEELLTSGKNLIEHQFVIDHALDSIKPYTTEHHFKEHLVIRKLANIQHISTLIEASLDDYGSIFKIIKALYPTPAVCGFPKEKALNVINNLEFESRGLYSGLIGWYNFNNEGEFFVSIRSALSKGHKIYAYAGSGIVEDSIPGDEFRETELKLKPIISLFNENKN
jgi:menaquinone-specific isochorismate synthase